MMLSTLVIVYPAFYCWSKRRVLLKNATQRKMWDSFWLFAYLLYMGRRYLPFKLLLVSSTLLS